MIGRIILIIFSVKEQHDLENWVRGCSRSLKTAPFDRPHTTFYQSGIVNIYLVQFLSYLTLSNIVTLKSGLEVTQDHLNWYQFEWGGWLSGQRHRTGIERSWVRIPVSLGVMGSDEICKYLSCFSLFCVNVYLRSLFRFVFFKLRHCSAKHYNYVWLY